MSLIQAVQLRLWDVCKQDIKSTLIGIETGEPAAVDCDNWRQAVQSSIRKAEERRNEVFELWLEKRGEIDL